MEASIEASVFKTAIRGLEAIVSESRLHFNKHGMSARAVDPAKVAIVIVDVPSESFEVYQVEKETTIGADISRIADIIKSVKKEELINIAFDGSRITVQSGNMTYTLAAIDPSDIRREPKVPDLDVPATVSLKSEDFKKAILVGKKISDFVTLRTDESGFYVEAEGDVEKISFYKDEGELIEFNKAEAKSMFSIDYLESFIKIDSDILTIQLGTDYPASFQFDLGTKDGSDIAMTVEYLLAPRIETE